MSERALCWGWVLVGVLWVAALALLAGGVVWEYRQGVAASAGSPRLRPEQPVGARVAADMSLSAPAALRCSNGDPPRVWSQAELEGQVHIAIKARDTAMANVWNDAANRWLRIGDLTMRIVEVCKGAYRE